MKTKIIALLLLCAASAGAQEKYVVTGNISGLVKPMKAILQYGQGQTFVRDSVTVKDGKFRFKTNLDRPTKVSLTLRQFNPPANPVLGQVMKANDYRQFYLIPGTTTIAGNSLASSVINNSLQEQYEELQKNMQILQKESGPVNLALFYAKDPDSIKMLKKQQQVYSKRYNQLYLDFIKKYPDSYVSYDVVQDASIVIEDTEGFDAMFNALSPKFRNTDEGKILAHKLLMAKNFAVGKPIMEFTQSDVNGKIFSLSSLKGKYVLIDFWASWCGPCRMEYPYLHKAYDKFKDKNFEIVGISLDDKRDLWVNAIKENKFDWIMLSDLKGRKNKVAVDYGISAIPQSLLVGPDGIIIAKNLRGDNLIEKLNEVIN